MTTLELQGTRSRDVLAKFEFNLSSYAGKQVHRPVLLRSVAPREGSLQLLVVPSIRFLGPAEGAALPLALKVDQVVLEDIKSTTGKGR